MNSSDGGTAPRPQSGPRATYPEQRGSTRSRRRWFVGLSVLVVVAGVAIAALGYTKFGDEDVKGEGTGYELIDSSTVAVQFTLTRSDPSKPAVCVVRGRSKDGSETGRRDVLIAAGPDRQQGVRALVKTSQPPVIGEVFGCTVTVPAYLREPTG